MRSQQGRSPMRTILGVEGEASKLSRRASPEAIVRFRWTTLPRLAGNPIGRGYIRHREQPGDGIVLSMNVLRKRCRSRVRSASWRDEGAGAPAAVLGGGSTVGHATAVILSGGKSTRELSRSSAATSSHGGGGDGGRGTTTSPRLSSSSGSRIRPARVSHRTSAAATLEDPRECAALVGACRFPWPSRDEDGVRSARPGRPRGRGTGSWTVRRSARGGAVKGSGGQHFVQTTPSENTSLRGSNDPPSACPGL